MPEVPSRSPASLSSALLLVVFVTPIPEADVGEGRRGTVNGRADPFSRFPFAFLPSNLSSSLVFFVC